MKVVLLENTVAGDKWQIIEVTDGYARNYLFPNKKAMPATDSNLKTTEEIKKQQAKKIALEKQVYEELAQKITKLAAIEIAVKAGENGKLFGAVTSSDIAEKIKELANIEIDRKRLQVRNLKEAGKYTIAVNFPFHISTKIEIVIKAEVQKEEQVQDMREIMHKKKRSHKKYEHSDEKVAEKAEEKESKPKNKKKASE